MPFLDVGTTKRLAMPQMRILRISEASAGICCLCKAHVIRVMAAIKQGRGAVPTC